MLKFIFIRLYLLPLILTFSSLMLGCSTPKSKEKECLESQRLYFNDPDTVEIIANLGSRTSPQYDTDKGFWVRYKAKNAYGAFVQSNMYCSLDANKKWKRDSVQETIALLDVTNKLLDKNVKIAKDNFGKGKDVWYQYGYLEKYDLDARANEIVFHSPENL